MTRSQKRTSPGKTCIKRSSSVVPVNATYSCGGKILCLTNLFSDLSVNVSWTNKQRVWGRALGSSRRKRSNCLVSLLDKCEKREREQKVDDSLLEVKLKLKPKIKLNLPLSRQEERTLSCGWGFFPDASEDGEVVAQGHPFEI